MTPASYSIEPGAAGQRLDVYLAAVSGLARSQVQRRIQRGLVAINGRPERSSYQTQAGDVVLLSEETAAAAIETPPNLPIVYEDDDILVVNKPAGLAVHSGAGLVPAPTVADFARPRTSDPDTERPGIIHRLDRDTSGLLIIAKTSAAKIFMQAAFKAHKIHKTYTLLAVGRVDPEAATIRLPIGRNHAHPLLQAVVAGGREAITAYKTEAYFPGYTLIEAKPQTGRTHQLRVHFAALGHPIAGDTSYGAPKRQLGLKRQFLHATALEFDAPSGNHIELASPLPSDLAQVLANLEEQAAK